MSNPFNDYFKSIADAIRERFNTTDVIWLEEFAHRIESTFPVTPMTESDTYIGYMDKILRNTASAIRRNLNSNYVILGKDIPNEIRTMRAVSYGQLEYAGIQRTGWDYGSVPSIPTVSISQNVYTLTWEYTWSHSSYDKYRVASVSISADWSNNSIYNPAANVVSKPVADETTERLYLRCVLERKIDLSGLISNMQSLGAPTDEILSEMRSELSSAIDDVNRLAGTFSFNIGYYGGTYV